MNLTIFLPILSICYFHQTVDARIFEKCALVRELIRLGVPHFELADWICIAQYESCFDTRAINPSNTDGSKDWGIFQINDRYWCDPQDGRQSANVCGISCQELFSDNISIALKCAQMIKNTHGFKAWVAWNIHCQHNKPDISMCLVEEPECRGATHGAFLTKMW